jgi:hypothetical protein
VSVSVPVASEPAGMLIVALPLVKVVDDEVYPPPLNVTDPVGVGFPLPPLTTTVTVRACVDMMLEADGVTVTVGLVFAWVTVTAEDVPVALLYVEELEESGVYMAVSVSGPVASLPAGMLIVKLPLVSVAAADV